MATTIFPLTPPDGIQSLRFYKTGTATGNYTDSQWQFTLNDGKTAAICSYIRITAATADLTFSFDGTTTHGVVKSGTTAEYRNRYESGITVKGVGSVFTIEAW